MMLNGVQRGYRFFECGTTVGYVHEYMRRQGKDSSCLLLGHHLLGDRTKLAASVVYRLMYRPREQPSHIPGLLTFYCK